MHNIGTSTTLPLIGPDLSTPSGMSRLISLEASRCASAAATLAKYHAYPNETPTYIILFHAIELGLKAFLIKDGMNEKILRNRPYGHNLSVLYNKAIERGLKLDDVNADQIIRLINEWHRDVKIRYVFDIERTLPMCSDLIRLADAIVASCEGIPAVERDLG